MKARDIKLNVEWIISQTQSKFLRYVTDKPNTSTLPYNTSNFLRTTTTSLNQDYAELSRDPDNEDTSNLALQSKQQQMIEPGRLGHFI